MIRLVVRKRLDRKEQLDLLTAVAEQLKVVIDAKTETFAVPTPLLVAKHITHHPEPPSQWRQSKLENVQK